MKIAKKKNTHLKKTPLAWKILKGEKKFDWEAEWTKAAVIYYTQAPANPVTGSIYHDINTSTTHFYDGKAWIPVQPNISA
ncbi:MAG TPA: hypothetical protein VFM18_17785 [Methanosarcina sp.]|nr:hypothetical protein [Methanosarcina sp.]